MGIMPPTNSHMDAPPKNSPGPRLFGFSILSSLGAVATLLLVAGTGLWCVLRGNAIEEAEYEATHISEVLRDCELRQLVQGMSSGGQVSLTQDRMQEINGRLRAFLVPFKIVNVKLYDTNGRIVYSTDRSIIGKRDEGNSALAGALAGQTATRHERKDSVRDLAGVEHFDVEIVEAYAPIRDAHGQIIGALGIHEDITEHLAAANDVLIRAEAVLLATTVGIFAVLVLVVHRAARTIRKSVGALRASEADFRQTNAELAVAKEQLSDVNGYLEKKVDQRTAQVQDLLDQKVRFIRQLGHDLRTPLTPLVAVLPSLERRISDPQLKEMVRLGNDGVRYIRHLVDRTLLFMRYDAMGQELESEGVDLLALSRNAVASWAPNLAEKSIVVHNNITAPTVVQADHWAIREVLDNLISNAMKYMGGKGDITLSACLRGDMVATSVTDTGIGITAKEIGRVFEEFYKVDQSRHDRSSVGLGLAICHRIIREHGGTILVESGGLDRGTTVTFTLPSAGGPGATQEQADDARTVVGEDS